jgi:hypothetical protein
VAPNPNPARITEPMWRFIERVVALNPNDTVYSGSYVLKPGYHATVDDNLSRWPGNYSIRLAADLKGPRDKTRGIDFKSKQAAAGAKPTVMATRGARVRAAAKAGDPRVSKWREYLGQFDVDQTPEAIDFQTLVERQPDSTHEWHEHLSILTQYVNDPEAYDAMYSVLSGQSLADYQKGRASMVDLSPESERQLDAVDETLFRVLIEGANAVALPPHPAGTPWQTHPVWLVAAAERLQAGVTQLLQRPPAEAVVTPEAEQRIIDGLFEKLSTKLGDVIVQALLDPQVRQAGVEDARQGAELSSNS